MSVGSALSAAVSGLRMANAGMTLVAANVANADNPGYTRKTLASRTQVIGEQVVGVRSSSAQRTLDTLLQRTLRVETAGASYAGTLSRYTSRLDTLYGPPGSDSALTAVFNRFTGAMQDLVTSPENPIARQRAVGEAGALTQRLNGLSEDIQSLRTETEVGLRDAVERINDALQRLSAADQQIIMGSGAGREPVNLLDQRDQALDELSRLMDIRVETRHDNSVSVFTRSGVLLFDRAAVTLSFDQRAMLAPENVYDPDPTQRGVGAITLRTPNGNEMDLIAQGAFRSGEVAALIHLRDEVLPDAQAQLDQLAAGLARAMSDRERAGTAASLGPQAGFALDTAGMQPGDVASFTVTQGGQTRTISIVRVDDPSRLPLPRSATADPNDQVIGVDFSGGTASAAAQIQAALGTGFTADSPVAGTIRLLDDGAAGTTDVTAARLTYTETDLQGGTAALPFFVDRARSPQLFTGSFDGGDQTMGFAGRIGVNQGLISDPGRLVQFAANVTSGDPTRPRALIDRLTTTPRTFGGTPGIGTEVAPASATLSGFVNRIATTQGQQAQTAKLLADGQDVVVNGLQDRFDESARVNVDEEMARLIELQQTFQASARIISVVDQMMQSLLQSV